MILTELTSVASATLPVSQFSEHLRLGTDFAETSLQDNLLEAYLRSAISTIEGRTGRVVLQKSFSWQLTGWRHADIQVLPVRPVVSITALRIYDRAGAVTNYTSDDYDFLPEDQAPAIKSIGSALPLVPDGGNAEIEFVAGHAADWDGVPNDLGQAVILLAAHFYENRSGSLDSSGVMPMAVLSLIERYRPVRVFGAAR
jgi:uncharacterized phiE125 gp8 family phage protein